MFSSARNGLEKAAAAEAAGVSSDLVADENIEVRGKLARALSRASRLLCPTRAATDAAAEESASPEEAAERLLSLSEDEENAAAETAMQAYRLALNEGRGEDEEDGVLPVPCDGTTIRFLESCFDIDSGAHSDQHSAVCNWFREVILSC